MEGDRKFVFIISLSAVVLFAFAYFVGYFVGKQAGVKEEKAICEIEKRQIVKTLSRLTPVSRPQPQIEEKVVGELPPQPATNGEAKAEEEGKETAKVNGKVKPEGEAASSESQKTERVKEAEKEKRAAKPQSKQETAKRGIEPPKKEEAQVSKGYYLQLGVFRNHLNAVKLAKELRDKGFDAKVEFSGNYSKVVVGYYKSLQEALTVKKELLRSGYKSVLKRRKG
ncbi:SPOR domain-containing protein [Thermovibrio sp.]